MTAITAKRLITNNEPSNPLIKMGLFLEMGRIIRWEIRRINKIDNVMINIILISYQYGRD